jgi:hypothetical protein
LRQLVIGVELMFNEAFTSDGIPICQGSAQIAKAMVE